MAKKISENVTHEFVFRDILGKGTFICTLLDHDIMPFRLTLEMQFGWLHMQMPDPSIHYFLATTDQYKVKYRQHGGKIIMYVTELF